MNMENGKEVVQTAQQEGVQKQDGNIKIDITTHEPSLLDKILQVYWLTPDSWLLKRFQVEDNNLMIQTFNGNKFSAPLNECNIRYQQDKFDRYEIIIRAGNQKIHFKEMLGMLEEKEWDRIIQFCLQSMESKKSVLGKIGSVLGTVKGIIME